jgi:hypothetical protein
MIRASASATTPAWDGPAVGRSEHAQRRVRDVESGGSARRANLAACGTGGQPRAGSEIDDVLAGPEPGTGEDSVTDAGTEMI